MEIFAETLTTTSLTTSEAAVAGAVAGGLLGVIGAIGIAVFVLLIVAMWKLFKKAGEPGWKSLIPIYNTYILFKISGAKGWFWALLIISFVGSFISVALSNGQTQMFIDDGAGNLIYNTNISPASAVITIGMSVFELVAYIVLAAKLSRAFKRGLGTTLGLIFFPNIFTLILAFGSAKYDKKVLKD